MPDWYTSWVFQLALWGAILLMMLATAYLIVRNLRDSTVGAGNEELELLTDFREMQLQGDLSDQEFRTIKSLLDAKPSSASDSGVKPQAPAES